MDRISNLPYQSNADRVAIGAANGLSVYADRGTLSAIFMDSSEYADWYLQVQFTGVYRSGLEFIGQVMRQINQTAVAELRGE